MVVAEGRRVAFYGMNPNAAPWGGAGVVGGPVAAADGGQAYRRPVPSYIYRGAPPPPAATSSLLRPDESGPSTEPPRGGPLWRVDDAPPGGARPPSLPSLAPPWVPQSLEADANQAKTVAAVVTAPVAARSRGKGEHARARAGGPQSSGSQSSGSKPGAPLTSKNGTPLGPLDCLSGPHLLADGNTIEWWSRRKNGDGAWQFASRSSFLGRGAASASTLSRVTRDLELLDGACTASAETVRGHQTFLVNEGVITLAQAVGGQPVAGGGKGPNKHPPPPFELVVVGSVGVGLSTPWSDIDCVAFVPAPVGRKKADLRLAVRLAAALGVQIQRNKEKRERGSKKTNKREKNQFFQQELNRVLHQRVPALAPFRFDDTCFCVHKSFRKNAAAVREERLHQLKNPLEPVPADWSSLVRLVPTSRKSGVGDEREAPAVIPATPAGEATVGGPELAAPTPLLLLPSTVTKFDFSSPYFTGHMDIWFVTSEPGFSRTMDRHTHMLEACCTFPALRPLVRGVKTIAWLRGANGKSSYYQVTGIFMFALVLEYLQNHVEPGADKSLGELFCGFLDHVAWASVSDDGLTANDPSQRAGEAPVPLQLAGRTLEGTQNALRRFARVLLDFREKVASTGGAASLVGWITPEATKRPWDGHQVYGHQVY